MLKTWWNIVVTAAWIIGGLFSFFFPIEVLRAYQTLHDFHPVAGYVFLFAISCLTVWVFWYFFAALVSRPPVLVPPAIGEPQAASILQLRRYTRYLARYLGRLRNNPALSPADRQNAADALAALCAARKTRFDQQDLLAAIDTAENAIQRLLETIDACALRQIRASMRDVMVGVTLSPWKAADLLIVLYRNLVMVTRIIHVYNARPRFRQQLSIYADIVRVIATVNYINMGKNLIEGLGSRVPGIGRFIDDIAQGMGAGFMTTVVGHAAMDRCRAYRPWNEAQAKDSLKNRAAAFYGDVKDTFWVDVWPTLRTRAGAAAGDLRDKIASALDETQNAITSCIKAPVNGAVYATKVAGRAASYSVKGIIRLPRILHRKTPPGTGRQMHPPADASDCSGQPIPKHQID